MIKFFRKIRLDALSRKRYPKYLTYALGEIVLVVIGILIALQINNWNEQNKIDKEEKFLLIGLISNINQDITNLNNTLKSDSTYQLANKIVLNAFINDSIRKNKEFLASNMVRATFNSDFDASQSVFNEIKFSGKLSYISSDTIRNNIQTYYDLIESVVNLSENNQKLLHQLSVEQRDFLDVNSYGQSFVPEYAQLELDEFDNSFFYESITSPKVIHFANLITSKQALMEAIDNSYRESLEEGVQLKQHLIKYLKTK